MRVGLIYLPQTITAHGLRIISSSLKQHGHKVDTFFLNWDKSKPFSEQFAEQKMQKLVDRIKEMDLLGISLMTNEFYPSIKITERVKEELDIPVIWGGIHPTLRPEECLESADMVCVGEGEEAFSELVDNLELGKSTETIQNIWFKNNGRIIKNSLRPLLQNLDSLPFPDWNLDNDYIFINDNLTRMDKTILREKLKYFYPWSEYPTMFTRGCPHACTYCCNNTLRKIYGDERYLRKRSVSNVINELEEITSKYEFIEVVNFIDDNFFALSKEELRNFCRVYKDKIALKFRCLVSPAVYNEEKMKLLIDAGLVVINMGIQSGCERVRREIYNRPESNERILKAARSISKLTSQAGIYPPRYDIIIDNPFETVEDQKESLNLLLDLPKPHDLNTFHLIPYFGTDIYEKIKEKKRIDDEEIYSSTFYTIQIGNYYNILVRLYKHNLPKPFLKFLSNTLFIHFFNTRTGLIILRNTHRIYGFVYWNIFKKLFTPKQ